MQDVLKYKNGTEQVSLKTSFTVFLAVQFVIIDIILIEVASVLVKARICRHGRRIWGIFQYPTTFYGENKKNLSGYPDQSPAFQANDPTTE